MGLRMLERLASFDLSDDQRRVMAQQDLSLRSIQRHLLKLLNTRAGSVLVDPDYGVPDLSVGPGTAELASADMMAQALLAVIDRYEPRLQKPKLRIVLSHDDNISTRLVLEGWYRDGNETVPMTLQGDIGADGVIDFDSID